MLPLLEKQRCYFWIRGAKANINSQALAKLFSLVHQAQVTKGKKCFSFWLDYRRHVVFVTLIFLVVICKVIMCEVLQIWKQPHGAMIYQQGRQTIVSGDIYSNTTQHSNEECITLIIKDYFYVTDARCHFIGLLYY